MKNNFYLKALIAIVLGVLVTKAVTKSSFYKNFNKSYLKLETNLIDFGEIKFNSEAKAEFIFSNESGTPLEISNIEVRCGCTVADWLSKKVLKSQKDTIVVGYDTTIKGYFTKEIIIHSNSKTSPDRVFVKGIVKE